MSALTDQQLESATEMLVAAREKRLALAGLPAELTPDNLADVQRVINAVSTRLDSPVRGWKTYCLYKPMQPVFYAPIYDLLPSGADIEAERLARAAHRARDHVPHRPGPPAARSPVRRSRDPGCGDGRHRLRGHRFALLAAAARTLPGFPAVGSLYGSFCDHISNGAIVVGDAIPDWRDIAFEDVRLRMTEDDRELVSVLGCHPIDNPVLPVVAGVNRLRRHLGVKAGDVMITSSSTSFLPVAAGAEIHAVYEGLGEVRARFSPS